MARFWVLTAAALSVFVLYAPQPLLPLFASLFAISEPTAGLIMTAAMVPLAMAPLSYGYLLRYIQAMGVLRVSLLLLAVLTALTGLVQTFPQMLALRFLQGMAIPASLTAVMAFLARPGLRGTELQRSMSLYVAATISGGFLGRLLAGVGSAFVNWQVFFFLLAIVLILCFFLVGPHRWREVGATGKPRAMRGSLSEILPCVPVYLAIFLLFSIFCGTLNYLPFRLVELTGTRSEMLAGLMYCGYVTGIVTSMGAGTLIRMAGSQARIMIGGYLVFIAALFGMLLPDMAVLFVLLFPFCGAMFLVHCVATAVVNNRVTENRGMASAVYVSSYYCGGVAGTYLPGFIYESAGWGTMVTTLGGLGTGGILLLAWYFFRDRCTGDG
ncbi:MAG: MFS transporter [Desulfobulbaceae bacterium]